MNNRRNLELRLIRLRNLITQLDTLLLSCLDLTKNQTFANGIQEVTEKILETRRLVVAEISPVKETLAIPIHCVKRETDELNRLKQLAREIGMQVSAAEIESFFVEIFNEAKLIQTATALEGQPRLTK